MMDPGMMGAPLPADPMAAAAPAPKAIDMVIAALGAMQQERQGENDAVLQAVLAATQGGMPSGMGGVSEGAPFAAPAGPEMGAY